MKTRYYGAALLALGLGTRIGQAQTLPTTAPAAIPPPAAATWLPHTLVKLNTGLNRQTSYGGYSGLTLPLILGAEQQLNTKFSAYGEASSSLNFSRRDFRFDNRRIAIGGAAAEVGGRYYYNQAKRARLNRAHGPFVGNYLALAGGAQLDRFVAGYRFADASVEARWGMQRRIGQWGFFDGSAGMGVGREAFGLVQPVFSLNARIGLAH